jgi:hypothetical protein
MNVALTRAKFHLIDVGNVWTFQRIPNAPTLNMLVKDAEAHVSPSCNLRKWHGNRSKALVSG